MSTNNVSSAAFYTNIQKSLRAQGKAIKSMSDTLDLLVKLMLPLIPVTETRGTILAEAHTSVTTDGRTVAPVSNQDLFGERTIEVIKANRARNLLSNVETEKDSNKQSLECLVRLYLNRTSRNSRQEDEFYAANDENDGFASAGGAEANLDFLGDNAVLVGQVYSVWQSFARSRVSEILSQRPQYNGLTWYQIRNQDPIYHVENELILEAEMREYELHLCVKRWGSHALLSEAFRNRSSYYKKKQQKKCQPAMSSRQECNRLNDVLEEPSDDESSMHLNSLPIEAGPFSSRLVPHLPMPSTLGEQDERDAESEEEQHEHHESYEPDRREGQCEAYDQAGEIESLEDHGNVGDCREVLDEEFPRLQQVKRKALSSIDINKRAKKRNVGKKAPSKVVPSSKRRTRSAK
ncbi:hypothetical protein [Parasitella parasitica]|uniref:Uncharacterized protein n=1 Tax=Parasitella parasitica TaxID=35722 RepID=A0A0B7NTG5_9FUNG|nr:hypothetical protein [Parasitella parasitica]